jgi:acetyl esterase
MAHPLLARAEAAAFRWLMALPRPVMRRLAGKPVVIDGQMLDTETQWLLRLKELLREVAVETLPIEQGRRTLARQAALAGGRQPIGRIRDLRVPGADGPLAARLYEPSRLVSTGWTSGDRADAAATGDRARRDPLLVFLHGGGMIYGDMESYDAVCRVLAERAGVRVLALDYRLAPEHRFPAAVEDCWASYQWVVEHADRLDADPERIAVGGDSAGGYLSAVVALKAAEAGVPCRFQLLVYPVTNMAEASESRRLFGSGFYLTDEFIDLAAESYLADDTQRRDPLASVHFTEKIPGDLAPALVVTAGFDPLRDEGEAWARRLADSGVEVELRRYPGFMHGFINVVGVGRTQRAAVHEIADRLAAALA